MGKIRCAYCEAELPRNKKIMRRLEESKSGLVFCTPAHSSKYWSKHMVRKPDILKRIGKDKLINMLIKGMSLNDIAKKYNVSVTQISDIKLHTPGSGKPVPERKPIVSIPFSKDEMDYGENGLGKLPDYVVLTEE